MPRFNLNTFKYSDSVKHKSGNVTLEYDTKFIVDRILACLEQITKKNAAEYVGMILWQLSAKYVPNKQGNLLKDGMYISTRTPGVGHAEVDLRVRNTKKVPYALYQYYGNVWGPNYATWEGPKFDPKNLKMSNSPAVHSGWVSPKGKGSKHQTGQVLGVKRTITLKDGRIIHIDGYTNPESKPLWLDYVRKTPTIWVPYTRQVQRDMKEMFDDAWFTWKGLKPSIKYLKLLRSQHKGAEAFNPKFNKE